MIWKAVQYMLFSVFMFSLMNISIKNLVQVSVYQIVFFRGLTSLILCLIYLRFIKVPIFGTHKTLLFLRGFVGTVAMSLFFYSVKLMPLGTAVTLRYTAPIFAAIFAIFLLKDKIKPMQWLYFIMAFIGILLLEQFNYSINLYSLSIILTSAILSGLV